MQPFNFPEANVPAVQKPSGWKDEDCSPIAAWFGNQTLPSGEEIPSIITAWHPTAEELKLLNEGGPVYLFLTANGLPPHFLTAHNPFEPISFTNGAEMTEELRDALSSAEAQGKIIEMSPDAEIKIIDLNPDDSNYLDDPIVEGKGYFEGFENTEGRV